MEEDIADSCYDTDVEDNCRLNDSPVTAVLASTQAAADVVDALEATIFDTGKHSHVQDTRSTRISADKHICRAAFRISTAYI